jgi:hypothetical protein
MSTGLVSARGVNITRIYDLRRVGVHGATIDWLRQPCADEATNPMTGVAQNTK